MEGTTDGRTKEWTNKGCLLATETTINNQQWQNGCPSTQQETKRHLYRLWRRGSTGTNPHPFNPSNPKAHLSICPSTACFDMNNCPWIMIVISPSVSLCFLARRIRAKHNAGYLLMPCHLVLTLSHLTYPPHLRESGIRLCCAQQELTNSLTRPTWAKLVTRQGPVPNSLYMAPSPLMSGRSQC